MLHYLCAILANVNKACTCIFLNKMADGQKWPKKIYILLPFPKIFETFLGPHKVCGLTMAGFHHGGGGGGSDPPTQDLWGYPPTNFY